MFKTRFAPTPSGYLHRGNAASFVLAWAWARANGGKILLRIDDLDAKRMRLAYLEDIFRTIDWLGLDYDEGATGVDDFLKNWSQHKRLDLYENALNRLQYPPSVSEAFLYACTCSRKQIQTLMTDGVYPQICRDKQLALNGLETAWRVALPSETSIRFKARPYDFEELYLNLTEKIGDFVVRQKNGLPAYQLASVVDDVHFGVNHIVRGEDLLDSTAAQLFLAGLLGLDVFSKTRFFHHKLVKNTEGGKLSKSKGAEAVATEREAGLSPLPIIQQAATWLGKSPNEVENLNDLVHLMRDFIPLPKTVDLKKS
jgi:glutamyl/glutaminyl-tRNA synthetase